MHIQELIERFEELGKRARVTNDDITCYCNFIFGLYAGLGNTRNELDVFFSNYFHKWVLYWIENNIDPNYAPVKGWWDQWIKDISTNEENEKELFFRICKEFFEMYENKGANQLERIIGIRYEKSL